MTTDYDDSVGHGDFPMGEIEFLLAFCCSCLIGLLFLIQKSHYVTLAGLELTVQTRLLLNVRDPSASASQELRLKVCNIIPGYI